MTSDLEPNPVRALSRPTQPAIYDLLALVKPKPSMKVVDLGCGTGELTQELHVQLGASTTIGIDSSASMLERAAAFATTGLTFQRAEIESLTGETATISSSRTQRCSGFPTTQRCSPTSHEPRSERPDRGAGAGQ